MSQPFSNVFGIDLGTTYSCIAHVDEHGKPVVIPNSEGDRVTPSVVFFESENVIVGETAKENAKLYPDDVVAFVKRSMGDANFAFEYAGQTLKPEEISSYVLRKLVKDARENLGIETNDVVITCPAYFGINEREATRKAGEIAGLNVRAIINEPTAAAIAYGMADESKESVVLVFDLGGGTFDITMIDIRADAIEVICTGGDHNLGGKDWDDCINRYLVDRIEEESGASPKDITNDPETRQSLVLESEKAKKTLSARDKAPISILHDIYKVKVELTRNKFEELTADRLERTIVLTNDMLEEARKKGYEQYDEILLVGGSTRMPQIAAKVREAFGKEPKVFDPDESVAKGAALYGWKLSLNDALVARIAAKTGKSVEEVQQTQRDDALKEVVEEAAREVADISGFTIGAVKRSRMEIKNVCSKSFGVVARNEQDKELVFNLILKNTTVPVDVTQRFGTHEDNQETVEIQIMEDEVNDQTLEPAIAVEIGKAILEMPAGLPKHAPLDITFRLNEEGRLEMTAVERNENRTVSATIETNSVIAGEELEEAKQRSSALVVS